MKKVTLAAVVGLACAVSALAQNTGESKVGPAEYVEIANRLAPSLVRVEYTLRTDKGEQPEAQGWGQRCPNCGRYHGLSVSRLVQEERPLAINGFLLSPTRVLVPDVIIHPRFVAKTEVAFGDERVAATLEAVATRHDGVLLALEKPLKGTRPLAFDAAGKPPYLALTYADLNGAWTITVRPAPLIASVAPGEPPFATVEGNALILTETGAPVAIMTRGDLPLDDSWKGSPQDWPTLAADALEQLARRIEAGPAAGIVRVQLGFRSPKKEATPSFSSDPDQAPTEMQVPGLVVGPTKLLVLASLTPKVTARLERIVVHPASGDPVSATFAHTLRDYGAFAATLEKALPVAVEIADGQVRGLRNHLLMAADVRIQGESRLLYLGHRRIAGFDEGWRRYLYPQMPGTTKTSFLFDTDGRLVALPVVRREKGGRADRYSRTDPALTAASQLGPVLLDLAQHSDPSNVPLSEALEARLAWMGVLLQPMNPQLAQLNKVSHLTEDGRTGAVVSYVYPESPAAKAGVKQGWIVLRLHVEDYPKPLDVRIEADRYQDFEFPWARLDELPEQYYDRVPKPWPPVENTFTRALTDIGFGKPYRAEFFTDGRVVFKEFTVVQSPTYYDSAPRYKCEALGVTVRDLTYEARRYFQKPEDDPGVIIGKIEPGSKASVAGVKPFEIVTHVNDQPVHNVGEFEKHVAGQTELRLSVKRQTRGRVVRIKLDDNRQNEPDAKKPDEPSP